MCLTAAGFLDRKKKRGEPVLNMEWCNPRVTCPPAAVFIQPYSRILWQLNLRCRTRSPSAQGASPCFGVFSEDVCPLLSPDFDYENGSHAGKSPSTSMSTMTHAHAVSVPPVARYDYSALEPAIVAQVQASAERIRK